MSLFVATLSRCRLLAQTRVIALCLTAYNITEDMLRIYFDLDTKRPGVLAVLREWQTALDNCFMYLAELETTITKLEHEIMILFNIEMREGKIAKTVTCTPKELDCATFKFEFETPRASTSVAQICRAATTIPIFYDMGKVAYGTRQKGPSTACLNYVSPARTLTWSVAKSLLRLTEDKKMVVKTGPEERDCIALASVWTLM